MIITEDTLDQFNSVPCFLIKVDISPLVAMCANLCGHLDEAPLVSEDGGDSISNCTAIAVPTGEAEELCNLPVLEVDSIK